MFIYLKEVASKGAVHIEDTVDLGDSLSKSASLTGCGPLQVKLEARDALGKAEITGEISIEIEQPCSRCLKPVRQMLNIPFFETFAVGVPPQEESNDEEPVEWVKEDRVDLTPYLVESIMLALPYAPLCDEACLGLCPECGGNRNEISCSCNQERVDPRLSGLADFFKQTHE